jgi:hypothetical protein
MRIGSPSTPPPAESARLARIAWFLSFAVTVAVIAGLLLVKSAQAATTPVADPPLAGVVLLAEEEEEDEGFEFEESDEGAEESEGEDEEGSEGATGREPPEECGLRTARGAVVADESRSALSTQVSYTSFEPVKVAIALQLNGGSLTLWRDHKRLGESGVLHASERLGRGQLAKVLAARNFELTIKVLDAPGYCKRYSDRHLKARRAVGDQVTWMQSDSVFGG